MKLRIIYNKILWELGIRKILPSHFIKKIKIKDNKEKLVYINQTELVREFIKTKIEEAEKLLPEGFSFFVAEGYRSPQKQQEMWNVEFSVIKKKNPNLDDIEIDRLTSLRIARPGTNSGAHQTGGAIDITVLDKKGIPLKMGTDIVEFNKKTTTESDYLNNEESSNRKILISALSSAGFNNYPAEWWHWSYGDRMWAAYKKKPYAIYGPIED